MNEDEQLRAQLRTAYEAQKANIDGLGRWIKAKVLTLGEGKPLKGRKTPKGRKASKGRKTLKEQRALKALKALKEREDAALIGKSGQIEEMARRVLDFIADDQTIDVSSRSLGLPKVFARTPDASHDHIKDRVIAWPSKPSVPHEVIRPTQTLALVYRAIDAWIEYLSDVVPVAKPLEAPVLNFESIDVLKRLRVPQQKQCKAVLQALKDLDARADHPIKRPSINDQLRKGSGQEITGNGTFGQLVEALKEAKLIESGQGQKGGYWLTDLGRQQ
jgi:hypothetical protein